ncbi:MAG: phosphate regulon transcriptional regulator PhoB [Chromatiales bacterium]|nr:phosphate regulon transcriptional regulator PhoB [Chromatiales bacterium]
MSSNANSRTLEHDAGARVLVVDDEPDLREMLVFSLESAGYTVDSAPDGLSAWARMADTTPDLVLLDWMLPDLNGVELLRRMRREPRLAETPVIMLTARGEETDRVRGLDNGADDYVTKPFSMRELLARMRANLRRGTGGGGTEVLQIGPVRMDLASHRVTASDEGVDLGPTEFRLLRHFMQHPDRVYSRTQLLDSVWGTNVYVEERTVDVHIRRLRKALEPTGADSLVQTVRGAGYRFSPAG